MLDAGFALVDGKSKVLIVARGRAISVVIRGERSGGWIFLS
jgi:DNA-binding protein